MFLFKKRKKESVAIPFLISMIITLIVVGIPALKYYNYKLEQKNAIESGTDENVFIPSEENNTNILFAYDPDDEKNEGLRNTFLILHTSAIDKSFCFIPISNEILYNNLTMADVYNKGGIIKLESAVSSVFDMKIDRYMMLDDEALSLICDCLGGVNYNVPSGLKGVNEGYRYLSSEFIMKLITNKKLEEDARTVTTGSVFSEMMSQTSGSRIVESLDYTFNKLVNLAETDITSIDYSNQKKAIEYILNSQYRSYYSVPTGTKTDSGIKIDATYLEDIKKEFSIK